MLWPFQTHFVIAFGFILYLESRRYEKSFPEEDPVRNGWYPKPHILCGWETSAWALPLPVLEAPPCLWLTFGAFVN